MSRKSGFEQRLHQYMINAEMPVANWLKRHGALVIPTCRYSGTGAPMLEAFSATESSILPDLFYARDGIPEWAEVKWKTKATATTTLGGRRDTGISIRHANNYWRVQKETGSRVFICFAHEEEDLVTFDSLSSLRRHPSKRYYRGKKMDPGGMVLWELSGLTPVASLTEVRGNSPPSIRLPTASRP